MILYANYKSKSKINFGGIPLGVAKVVGRDGKAAKLSLYKVTKKNDEFLGKLERSVDVKKLQDGFNDDQYALWNHLVKLGISECRYRGTGFLVAKDNVPCGILSYKPRYFTVSVPDVATWPVDKNKKVSFAGKAMFMELFKQVLKNDDYSQVFLVAMKDSVYSPAEHYKSVGFRKTSENELDIRMVVSRGRMMKALKEFKSLIDFTPAKNQDEVDLAQELKIKKRKYTDIFKRNKD